MIKCAAALPARRATNISLPIDLLAQARACGLNVPRACETGLRAEITRHRAAQWLDENRHSLISCNDYVAQNGLPLSDFRQF